MGRGFFFFFALAVHNVRSWCGSSSYRKHQGAREWRCLVAFLGFSCGLERRELAPNMP